MRISDWSSDVCSSDLDLLKGLVPEERVYRMRGVEGWSMVIPWQGVPPGEVLKKFEPNSKARYVASTSLADPKQMHGVRYRSINGPYTHGLPMDAAMNTLTLLATGRSGKPRTKPNAI